MKRPRKVIRVEKDGTTNFRSGVDTVEVGTVINFRYKGNNYTTVVNKTAGCSKCVFCDATLCPSYHTDNIIGKSLGLLCEDTKYGRLYFESVEGVLGDL